MAASAGRFNLLVGRVPVGILGFWINSLALIAGLGG